VIANCDGNGNTHPYADVDPMPGEVYSDTAAARDSAVTSHSAPSHNTGAPSTFAAPHSVAAAHAVGRQSRKPHLWQLCRELHQEGLSASRCKVGLEILGNLRLPGGARV
jgi:hypothetical protein